MFDEFTFFIVFCEGVNYKRKFEFCPFFQKVPKILIIFINEY